MKRGMPPILTNRRLLALLAGSPSTVNSIGEFLPWLTFGFIVVELMILFTEEFNMLITNNHNVPETIVRAVRKRDSEYSRGEAHRSATQLISPPRIDLLRKKNFESIETDVSQSFWPLLGTAVHKILELGATENTVLEERLFAEVDGWTISGAIDVQEYADGMIDIADYKVCTLFSVSQGMEGDKHEWIAQQNIYRWLVEKTKNIKVRSISIVAIIRDWQNSGIKRDPFYPPSPIVVIPLEMWTMEQTEEYIRERINIHRLAEMNIELGLEVPECSAAERWERDKAFKVKKIGGKRATKVFSTRLEAEQFMATLSGGYEIEEQEGSNIRCDSDYCQVARFCSQYAAIKAGKP